MFQTGQWFRSFSRTGAYNGNLTITLHYETQDGRVMYLLTHDTSGRTELLEETELARRVQK
jgi:hypothetical protein